MSNKHLKKGSISLSIKEMQTQTTLRFHLNQLRMNTYKKRNKKKSGEDIERKETLYIPLGMKSVWIQWKSM